MACSSHQVANRHSQWRRSLHRNTKQASRKAEPSHNPYDKHTIMSPHSLPLSSPVFIIVFQPIFTSLVMAEALGAVASGFAVVSLAIQVAETINKMRNFYSLMQSAPADILFAIKELETLSLILEDVDRSVQEQVFLDPKAKLGVMRSWRLCKTATQGLVALVEKLEDNLGGARGKMRAKIGVAMKKGEMDE